MTKIATVTGSIGIGLLTAGAGLVLDWRTLIHIGVGLSGLAGILWLFDLGRWKLATKQQVDSSELARKRQLIDKARGLAAHYTQGLGSDKSFRMYLEETRTYAALRGQLSKDYLGKLEAPMTVYAMADGAAYEPLVEGFVEELDRIEKAWRLD